VAAFGVGIVIASGLLRQSPPLTMATPTPTGTTPTAAPSPILPPLADALPPGSLATVIADVVMREQPSDDARQVTTIHAGQTLYVLGPTGAMLFGPVSADGAIWYPASYARDFEAWPANVDRLSGWVAVEASGVGLVEPRPAACPSERPTTGLLVAMVPWARVICYGDQELTLEGTWSFGFLIDEFGMVPWDGEPDWLAIRPEKIQVVTLTLFEEGATDALNVVLGPAMEIPTLEGQMVLVTGHFDAGAADECVIRTGYPLVEQPRESTQSWCREQFVVTRVVQAE
jgi:hypothetical protein